MGKFRNVTELSSRGLIPQPDTTTSLQQALTQLYGLTALAGGGIILLVCCRRRGLRSSRGLTMRVTRLGMKAPCSASRRTTCSKDGGRNSQMLIRAHKHTTRCCQADAEGLQYRHVSTRTTHCQVRPPLVDHAGLAPGVKSHALHHRRLVHDCAVWRSRAAVGQYKCKGPKV